MSAIDAIRAREAAKRPALTVAERLTWPEPLPEPTHKRTKKETHGRQAIEGDAGGSPAPGEPEAGPEATEEVDPE